MFQVQDTNVASSDINISFALDTTLISSAVKALSQWKNEKNSRNVQKYTKYRQYVLSDYTFAIFTNYAL